MILVLTLSIIRLLTSQYVLCDLPIHALTNELVGDWKISLTNTHSKRFLNCGGTSPNRNSSNLNDSIRDYKKYLINNYGNLTEHVVKLSIERGVNHSLIFPRNKWKFLNILDKNHNIIGNWTMVYDVGLDIRMCNLEAFGYLKYSKQDKNECVYTENNKDHSNYDFNCYKTDPTKIHIGWARRHDGTFECFYGEKIDNKKKTQGSMVIIRNNGNDEAFPISRSNLIVRSDTGNSYDLSGDKKYVCGHISPSFKIDSLPKSWSWSDLRADYSSTGNQGSCGSCYALASVWTIERRFEIGIKKLTKRSVQIQFDADALVKKSPYNQECKGGYPFLVGKDIKDFGIKSLNSDIQDRFYVKDYNYVGGCYECTNETLLMYEIYHDGPVVAAIYAGPNFISHKNGVYLGENKDDRKRFCDIPNSGLTGWEHTNHAVAIVGWGESDVDGKYWLVKNDWGREWGIDGYAKVRRGINLNGIESQATYFDPDFERGGGNRILSKIRIGEVHQHHGGADIL